MLPRVYLGCRHTLNSHGAGSVGASSPGFLHADPNVTPQPPARSASSAVLLMAHNPIRYPLHGAHTA